MRKCVRQLVNSAHDEAAALHDLAEAVDGPPDLLEGVHHPAEG